MKGSNLMSATSPVARHPRTLPLHLGRRAAAGAAGGIAGGLVFGMLMAFMGMLPMVASMVGSDSAAVGFGVHMVISVLIGCGLTVPFAGLLTSSGKASLIGLGYGARGGEPGEAVRAKHLLSEQRPNGDTGGETGATQNLADHHHGESALLHPSSFHILKNGSAWRRGFATR